MAISSLTETVILASISTILWTKISVNLAPNLSKIVWNVLAWIPVQYVWMDSILILNVQHALRALISMYMFVIFAQTLSLTVWSAQQMELPVLNVLLVINWMQGPAQIVKQDSIKLEISVMNAHQLYQTVYNVVEIQLVHDAQENSQEMIAYLV